MESEYINGNGSGTAYRTTRVGGVSATHPTYDARVDGWIKCRDAYEGSEAVKAAGPKYLPMLSGQTSSEYAAYVQRALFYPIVSKTVTMLHGMALFKPPVLEYSDMMAGYFEDNKGLQFLELSGNALIELLLLGRIGQLIDAPVGKGNPYIVQYNAESIINWRTNERDEYTLVVLVESTLEQSESDEFLLESELQYRVLKIEDGVYVQHIYDDDGKHINTIVPTFNGKTIDFIPFFTANSYGVSSNTIKPPMLDIVNVNLSHYMSSADLEHGRHYTGLPTPVAIGVDERTIMHIGSATAWIIPDPAGDAKFLEFTGQGLLSLEKALVEKQGQLASMSARLIDNSSRGSESADTVKMRYLLETASLGTILTAVESIMERTYNTIAEMIGSEGVSILFNKEFLSARLSSADVKNLVDSYISGGISKETLVYNLKRGDVAPISMSTDEIIGEINRGVKGVADETQV